MSRMLSGTPRSFAAVLGPWVWMAGMPALVAAQQIPYGGGTAPIVGEAEIPPPSPPGPNMPPGAGDGEPIPQPFEESGIPSPEKMPEAPYPDLPALPGAVPPAGMPMDFGAPAAPVSPAITPGTMPFMGGGELSGAAPLTGGFAGGASEAAIPMFGDFSPFASPQLSIGPGMGARPMRAAQISGPSGSPPIPIPAEGARINTRARVFKISDNQVPRPIDRLFFTFNHFEDVNDAINRRLNSNVFNIQAQRYVLGFEKTFWDRQASLGIRLPLNVVHADSVTTNPAEFDLTRSSTALGDLFVYSKFILYDDPANNFLVSGGLAMSIPVGPTSFAGAQFIKNPHSFSMQPYMALYKSFGRLFIIAFEAIDVPLNEGDTTVIFNDLAFGYVAYRNDDPDALVRLVAPVFEAHVNVPLSHRDPFDVFDEAGTPDVVNLTYGLNVQIGKRTILSGGLVTPVTGPRPFDFEAIALLNIYY